MLGIHRLTSDRADYYLADLAAELPPPYLPAAGPGLWVGRAAGGLGLSGSVDPAQFRAVLEGRHPATGRSMRSDRATVLGYDLTFSASKSASVLFGLGGEEVARQIVEGHHDAVRGALAYLEVHGVTACRRVGPERDVMPTSGMVAGAFTHGVSRQLEPHLHTHVVMANLVHGEDGRWSACDQRGLSAHRDAASAVYDAHLRAELTTRLGVAWTQAPLTAAQVRGVGPELLGEFSSRSADIRRHMAEVGAQSSRGQHVAWAVTRPAKSAAPAFEALAAGWQRRARGAGLERADLARVLGQRVDPRPSLSEHQFAAALSLAPDGGARRRDVVAAFAGAAPNGAPAPDLEQLTELWLPRAGSVPVGVAEHVHQRRAVVPPTFVLRALGPRPVNVADHALWRETAHAIDDYRQRWGITRSADTLGLASEAGLSTMPTPRLVDHLRLTQRVEEARTRMGRRPVPVVELDRGR
jgi:conjugative relaxase-like TrwC/TraI family protein